MYNFPVRNYQDFAALDFPAKYRFIRRKVGGLARGIYHQWHSK